MKTFKIGNVIRKVNDSNSPSYRIVGKWIHPHTKEYWYDLRDTALDLNAQATANVLYEGDTDDYELVEEEKIEENIKEELYKWYPIIDEGEFWLEDEVNPKIDLETCKRIYKDNMVTIVTNGEFLFNHDTSRIGWGTMAKSGDWKYMRIKLD